MHEQIVFSNSPPFRSFMDGLANYGKGLCIHGIFIEPHPMWRGLVDARRTSGLPVDRGPPYWPPTPGRSPPAPYDFDIESVPEAWKTFTREAGKESHPFIVTVWIFPLTTEQMQDFRALDQYVQKQPFFVRFQQRPIAQLAAAVDGASEITAQESGALGGFLQDQKGRHWGLTCGHVAAAVGGAFTLEDVGGTRYPGAGTVAYSNYSSIATVGASGLCNPYVSAGNPDTDGALLDLGAGFTATSSVRGLGMIDEIFDRKRLNSGSPVCMSGVKSGVEDYEIGGYGVTVKVKVTRGTTVNYHCFSHVFEFHDPTPPPSWMPSKAAQALLARPLLGDSGSWVCFRKETATCAYFGNLIAVENLSGIATFADSFLNWASTDHKLSLRVL
ncbi:MAG TPA: hypothetical protein VFA39_05165 [Steroidobacteraceae bacterium]|nr:hypothetical protein [Steroidobacteraceae bacterium]